MQINKALLEHISLYMNYLGVTEPGATRYIAVFERYNFKGWGSTLICQVDREGSDLYIDQAPPESERGYVNDIKLELYTVANRRLQLAGIYTSYKASRLPNGKYKILAIGSNDGIAEVMWG